MFLGVRIVESNGIHQIGGVGGKAMVLLPVAGVRKDNKNISFHYFLKNSTEVLVSATPAGEIFPSDFGSND
ncbi:hypothetical protein [Rathayibacter toxicus]|uniref:Uncharacterized protein n=1 Tax=Rathayibacter toxicus TaxID=145458 RepID=A0A0U1PTF3_9MICO|nr:hypothetical protein [Rathayibacter toxicus]KKM45679.1 hypothetical protein VT73_05835 [Rathayibacter toxicus]PPH25518.1 hypothetical protein C5D17_00385 [Rathayibacter toxicus]PPH61330.1 hypothetical protein C5C93_00385 [Rathayibacter toxicus]PPH65335.1 hypothetical protein C5D13_00425 [Rathayibacter toxicus]PPH69500.1 hypothetical protein C5D01_00420 [Rathayibacter toxicus]